MTSTGDRVSVSGPDIFKLGLNSSYGFLTRVVLPLSLLLILSFLNMILEGKHGKPGKLKRIISVKEKAEP